MAALVDGVDILFFVFVLASLKTILIALVDVPYQLWITGASCACRARTCATK